MDNRIILGKRGITAAFVLLMVLSTTRSGFAGGPNLLPNGDFKKQMEGWTTTLRKPAEGEIKITEDGPNGEAPALQISVTTPGEKWGDVSLQATGFSLTKGKSYTFRMTAKVEPPANVLVTPVSNDGAPVRVLGEKKIFQVAAEWNEYEFTFIADDTSVARLSFGDLSRAETTYSFANVSLTEEE